jgi:hypothetical protein
MIMVTRKIIITQTCVAHFFSFMVKPNSPEARVPKPGACSKRLSCLQRDWMERVARKSGGCGGARYEARVVQESFSEGGTLQSGRIDKQDRPNEGGGGHYYADESGNHFRGSRFAGTLSEDG